MAKIEPGLCRVSGAGRGCLAAPRLGKGRIDPPQRCWISAVLQGQGKSGFTPSSTCLRKKAAGRQAGVRPARGTGPFWFGDPGLEGKGVSLGWQSELSGGKSHHSISSIMISIFFFSLVDAHVRRKRLDDFYHLCSGLYWNNKP